MRCDFKLVKVDVKQLDFIWQINFSCCYDFIVIEIIYYYNGNYISREGIFVDYGVFAVKLDISSNKIKLLMNKSKFLMNLRYSFECKQRHFSFTTIYVSFTYNVSSSCLNNSDLIRKYFCPQIFPDATHFTSPQILVETETLCFITSYASADYANKRNRGNALLLKMHVMREIAWRELFK